MKALSENEKNLLHFIAENKAIPKDVFGKDNVIRLRRKDGSYLSILPCSVNENGDFCCFDLAEPSGNVLYCNIDLEFVVTLIENFGIETI